MDGIDLDSFTLAFDLNRIQDRNFKNAADMLIGIVRNQDSIAWRCRLQAARDIDRVANRCILADRTYPTEQRRTRVSICLSISLVKSSNFSRSASSRAFSSEEALSIFSERSWKN